jgi:hypothetical protein
MNPEQVLLNKTQYLQVMQDCPDPFIAWESTLAKFHIRDEYVHWLTDLANWQVFLTLTFRVEKPVGSACRYWTKLVRELNTDLVGKYYTRIVGHSYFSYALAIQYQRRGAIHFHVLVDKPLNFKLIHKLWGSWCGFAKPELIKNNSDCVAYTSSYILRGGVVDPYIARRDYHPKIEPAWWRFDSKQDLMPYAPEVLG